MQITFKNSEDLQNFLQNPKEYVTTYFGISNSSIKIQEKPKSVIPTADKLTCAYVQKQANNLMKAKKFTSDEFRTWMQTTFGVQKISDLPEEALHKVMDWLKGKE